MLPIVGYTNVLSVAPGESIDVMTGSFGASRYRADLRRIIQGDTNPDGPGYKDELIDLDLGGERPARQQALVTGSCVVVRDKRILCDLESFTIALILQPTLFGPDRQVIVSLPGQLEIYVDPDGKPGVQLSAGETTSFELDTGLRLNKWSLVTFCYDRNHEQFTLHATAMDAQGAYLKSTEVSAAFQGLNLSSIDECVIAAGRDEGGNLRWFFNGKIDRPCFFAGVIPAQEIPGLLADMAKLKRHPKLAAAWDFSIDISSTKVHDISPHRLGGEILNAPARGVTGWQWQGQSLNWQERPDLYSAIHFHCSDLYDAGWPVDFSIHVPRGLKSGIYAVRLVPDEDEDSAYFCVFVVRPPRGEASANSVVFLMPTASYMAYANHRLGLDLPGTELGMGRVVEVDRHHDFLQNHPEIGYSVYEQHDDGSGVFHTSRLRPIVDMQPGVKGYLGGLGSNVWQFNADTHITGWLDHLDQDYDVITDEDLHYEGLGLLKGYNVVITGTHPEYYTRSMLDSIQGFTDRGGRLMYMGGNGFYWVISFHDEMPGIFECRRSEAGIRPWEPGRGQFYHAFSGEYGGLWRRNGRAPNELCGVGMTSQGFDISEPYRLNQESANPRVAFAFDGIENDVIGDYGLCGGGAAGLEIDRADPEQGTPAHALVMGSSVRHTDIYLMTPEDLLDPTPDWTGTQAEIIRADLTFFETRGGGAVFSTGSIAWSGAMAWNGYDNDVSKLTANVLKRFDDQAPFEFPE